MTNDEIDALVASITWEAFEQTKKGEITIQQFTFRMRIGLYLEQAIQAILVDNRFVRTRPSPYPARYHELEKLEPGVALSCIYGPERFHYTVNQQGADFGWCEYEWMPPAKMSWIPGYLTLRPKLHGILVTYPST